MAEARGKKLRTQLDTKRKVCARAPRLQPLRTQPSQPHRGR